MRRKLKYFIIFFILCSIGRSFGQSRVLDVPFVTQAPYGNLCWAASITMVTNYYGNMTSMCELVEWARVNLSYPNRGTENCCNTPMPSLCNQGLYLSDLDEALSSENLSFSEINDIISLSSINAIINDDRPIIIQGVRSGGYHTMVVIGYDQSDLYYIDPWGGYFINSYSDAISTECLGTFNYKWQDWTHILTDQPCPITANIQNPISVNATIKAQNSINMSSTIGNSVNVELYAGNEINFASGFEILIGSTLYATISTNPCD